MKYFPEHYAQGGLLFFLHIPKTAGTSLTDMLKPAFSEDRCIEAFHINNARKVSPLIFDNAELLCGHYTHDIYSKRLTKQPDFVMTFLRNPVEHFISTFFHLKIDPTFTYTIRLTEDEDEALAFHEAIVDASLEAFLNHPMSQLFSNFQTRYLVRGLSSDYLGWTDVKLLPIAQKLLLELPFFGITEDFSRSVELLGKVLGMSEQLTVIEENRSRNRPDNYAVPEELLGEVNRRIQMDSALYTVAKLAFDARYMAGTSA